MSETKSAHGEIGIVNKPVPGFGWRQGTLGIGMLLLIVALFISAGAKGALGLLPAYVAGAGALLVVVSAVAGVVAWVSAKNAAGTTRRRSDRPGTGRTSEPR